MNDTPTSDENNRLITPEETAELLDLTLDQLAHLRGVGAGPEWGQLTRRVIRYDAGDVARWQARDPNAWGTRNGSDQGRQ